MPSQGSRPGPLPQSRLPRFLREICFVPLFRLRLGDVLPVGQRRAFRYSPVRKILEALAAESGCVHRRVILLYAHAAALRTNVRTRLGFAMEMHRWKSRFLSWMLFPRYGRF